MLLLIPRGSVVWWKTWAGSETFKLGWIPALIFAAFPLDFTLGFSFLICKRGLIIVTTHQGWRDNERSWSHIEYLTHSGHEASSKRQWLFYRRPGRRPCLSTLAWLLGGSNEMADGKGQKVYEFISAKIWMIRQDPACLKLRFLCKYHVSSGQKWTKKILKQPQTCIVQASAFLKEDTDSWRGAGSCQRSHSKAGYKTDSELLPLGHVISLFPYPQKGLTLRDLEIIAKYLRASPGWKSHVLAGVASGTINMMGYESTEEYGVPTAIFPSSHGPLTYTLL